MKADNDYYLGIDVGSVSTDLALLDSFGNLVDKVYLRTRGKPISILKEGLKRLEDKWPGIKINGVGTTGSGRYLAAVVAGADVVKNEITAHAVAASRANSDVKTVLEIGGQDSR